MIPAIVVLILLFVLFLYYKIPPIVERAIYHKETIEEYEFALREVEFFRGRVEFLEQTLRAERTGLKPIWVHEGEDPVAYYDPGFYR